jgi:hypothetical protein
MAAKLNRRRAVVQNTRQPALPRVLHSALGAIPVRMVEQPTAGEQKAWGTFDIEQRIIEIKSGMGDAATRQIFLHEAVHVALWDSGCQLTGDQEEAVCTALASFLISSGLVRL